MYLCKVFGSYYAPISYRFYRSMYTYILYATISYHIIHIPTFPTYLPTALILVGISKNIAS